MLKKLNENEGTSYVICAGDIININGKDYYAVLESDGNITLKLYETSLDRRLRLIEDSIKELKENLPVIKGIEVSTEEMERLTASLSERNSKNTLLLSYLKRLVEDVEEIKENLKGDK